MQNIDFDLKSSFRAKHLKIAVYPNGKVVVTKPVRISEKLAQDFVSRKFNWIQTKLDYYKQRKIVALETPQTSKNYALLFVKERLDFYNQHYRVNIGKVTIKNHRRLWGSCSSKNNLNFNHKIILLPQHQADYIIVHELCHIKELNHSSKFWALVAETIPKYKSIRRELNDYIVS